jgi:hypothetical protein
MRRRSKRSLSESRLSKWILPAARATDPGSLSLVGLRVVGVLVRGSTSHTTDRTAASKNQSWYHFNDTGLRSFELGE